jgi:biotin synthase
VAEVYNTPLLDLVFSAARVHRTYNDPSMVRRRPPAAAGTPRVLQEAQGHWKLCRPALACWLAGRLSNMLFDCRRRLPNHCTELSTAHPHPYPLPCSLLPCPAPVPQVQRCTLLSIKTGGCPENCGYCSQSSHWSKETGTKAEKLLGLEEVYEVGGWVGVWVGSVGGQRCVRVLQGSRTEGKICIWGWRRCKTCVRCSIAAAGWGRHGTPCVLQALLTAMPSAMLCSVGPACPPAGCPACQGLWQHPLLHGGCLEGALPGRQGTVGARAGDGRVSYRLPASPHGHAQPVLHCSFAACRNACAAAPTWPSLLFASLPPCSCLPAHQFMRLPP